MMGLVADVDTIVSLPGAASGDSGGFLFGFSLAGFLLASFFSLLGVAYLVYAKKQGRLVVGLCGVALMIFPFVVTNTIGIVAIGTVLTFLPFGLKRIGVDI